MNVLQDISATRLLNNAEWYKDAIIYQLHVKAFADSNGDGIGDFNGLTELAVTALSLISHDTPPSPVVITLSQLANGSGEAFEGQLVSIDNVAITSGLYPAPNASGNLTIADATGTGTLRVDSDTDMAKRELFRQTDLRLVK